MGCGGSKALDVAAQNAKSASRVIAQLSSSACEDSTSDSGGTDLTPTSPAPNITSTRHTPAVNKDQVKLSSMVVSDKLPDKPALPPVTLRHGQTNSSAVAFHIPLASSVQAEPGTDCSLVRKYPPRRFHTLEDTHTLTMESYQEKHAEAALRRKKIIHERVQSARSRNTRSAGRAVSRAATSHYDDTNSIEGGIGDSREQSADLI